ncbi:glycerate kinase [Tissierella creatinini]|nr:glycerate kinase [Tissierella creatinini]TJX67262.1 glycerate kinase [Soehngenia saccharolytica]
MKIIIAPDSFKGSMTAREVCDNIEAGFRRVNKDLNILKIPMADGGEGTLETLVEANQGIIINTFAKDPLFRRIRCQYGIINDDTAVIQMSRASGLTLLEEDERNPMLTTTFGTGELILHALDLGIRNFIIGLGGSATNDCGIGLLSALGIRFLDDNDIEVELNGGGLNGIRDIDMSNMDERIKESTFTIATDVENVLTGTNGAAFIYGPQKGANSLMVQALDRGLRNFAYIVEKKLGIDIENIKGAGAAGGAGGGLLAFLNGKITNGIDIIIQNTDLDEIIKDADLVITGEGRMDYQTQFGKAAYGVAKLAATYQVPVIAICGSLGEGYEALLDKGFKAILSIVDKPMNEQECMKRTTSLLQNTAENLMRILILDLAIDNTRIARGVINEYNI